MVAQPNPKLTSGELDAIYAVEAPYAPDTDWPPQPYPAPVSVAQIARKPRKPRPQIRVVGMDGVVHPPTDDTLEAVLAKIPHSALEPAPTLVLPAADSKPLPLDEPRVIVTKPRIVNHDVAKIKGGFAVPYFNQEPLVVPMGQRKLVPTSCWYRKMVSAQDTDGDTFWYRFEVMPGVIVGYSETMLKKLNGVGE